MTPIPTNIDWMMELRGTIAVASVFAWLLLYWVLSETDWNKKDDE